MRKLFHLQVKYFDVDQLNVPTKTITRIELRTILDASAAWVYDYLKKDHLPLFSKFIFRISP